ncbi:MBL fold metallo-hydrolase [Sphingomonas japonica]|uniref:Phosphoribosyl 1,2-cyclic phosphate phosphodiesterase n=1 Tax=Sphingomonas japonica TaxID=511662 RepID=A0ABX0U2Z6_9SPHN|nr:MBL fold metallo-hydrolase [Sphingomonas japonica]NIJ24864.1 phosphoribosyl 1,2-cyclic phosphate phosphodiesterase [Sphingomonas japonica]
MRVRILGCGTSSGVPRIGNDWGACDPTEPRNRRTRVSALIETESTRILIDTGPDLRAQLNDAKVATVDAIIWTHDHADHTHGIDDVRQLFHNGGRPVRGLARATTMHALRQRFGYVFAGAEGYRPTATIDVLEDELTIGDIRIRCVDQPHGTITSAGLRFDHADSSIVYSTDFNILTPIMHKLYEGADVWIVDSLREQPHPSHPHLSATLGWIESLRVGRAVLIHMDNSMDYATLAARLPPHVEPGYDGLEIAL